MKMMKKTAALLLALALLFSAAQAETWRMSRDNKLRFQTFFDKLGFPCTHPEVPLDVDGLDSLLNEIRGIDEWDYRIGRAIADHWISTVMDPDYKMYEHDGRKWALQLERSGLSFGKKHAFVVLGYQLYHGEMAAELIGRCEAAAAAARSFPDAILVCTGGATGIGPNGRTEGALMKDYLVNTCGIEEERIFAETEAKTTMENAVYSFPILTEQGVDTFTLVTSEYHQLWAQILFNAMAAIYRYCGDYKIRMVGNYNYVAYSEANVMVSCQSSLQQVFALFKKGVEISLPAEK